MRDAERHLPEATHVHRAPTLGPGGVVRAVVALLVALSVASCASVPRGRYGVRSVEIDGLEHLAPNNLEACLATRSRPRFTLGPGGDPSCNEPPFDSTSLQVRTFAWPWTEWPLFDPSIYERDEQRALRWLRARGYYEGELVSSSVTPPEARGTGEDGGACTGTEGCEVAVAMTLREGEPVLVARFEVHVDEEIITEDIRLALRAAVPFRRGSVFDEAVFDRARQAMVRVLADESFIDARVVGMVKVDVDHHEAFVAFEVEPGQRAVVGQICVRGTESLPPTPVLAATYLQPGQRFSLSALEEAQRAIYGLGTFASVEIRHRGTEATEQTTRTSEDGEVDLTATSTVPNPSPVVDPEQRDAEGRTPGEQAVEAPAAEAPPVLCVEPRSAFPENVRVVNLDIRVQPGRLERFSFGVGLQSGTALDFSSSGASSVSTTLSSNQWDIHALAAWEHRNVFDSMLRLRLEERPRLIFPNQFPLLENNGTGANPGNQIALDVRWPAFLEARTMLVGGLVHDYGPAPLVNFLRHELDGRIGLQRAFFDGRLALSTLVRGNLFLPEQDQAVRVLSQRETTRAIWLEQSVVVDLRDNPRLTREGVYAAFSIQGGGLGGISSWDYIRLAGEVRGYVPLPAGIVIAARFGMAGLEVFQSYGLDSENIYELATLGPLSQQLTGGGSTGNRGFPAGYLGDVSRREVELRPTPGQTTLPRPPALISGGVRRWDASLEVRLPLTSVFGAVLFADAGDVSKTAVFRFNVPQLSLGAGLRLIIEGIGTVRFDVAARPDWGQVIGPEVRERACVSDADTGCRPEATIFGLPIAAHITLGEAF